MIVGTDLKRSSGSPAGSPPARSRWAALISGAWLGLFVGLIFSIFTEESCWRSWRRRRRSASSSASSWALIGYAFSRGQRDFSSITQVVATRYEVLVEHKSAAAQARELLAKLPGALPEPVRA